MRSAVTAMLWENWRLTRVEAAQRFALGLVAGSAALFTKAGAIGAFWILIVTHGMCVWLSILKLNGGRLMDGYKPGFPFYLLYARPVPTGVFVIVAMVYDALSCAALYVISATLLGLAFGQPLPLFSAVLFIVTFHLCYTCVQWSTPSRVVQWVGSFAFSVPLFFLLKNRAVSSLQLEFSLAENVTMGLLCVLSLGLTIAGVARQRRGEAVESAPRAEGSGGYPDWLVNLFRFPCPTSSATRAQLWFELKSSGLPILSIGFGVSMLVLALFAIGISVTPARYFSVSVVMFAIPVALFGLTSNAFGIRRKQGRTYASTFEVGQPYGTAQMVSLKVLVRTACVLLALTMIGVSVWASSSLLSAWGAWMMEGKNASAGLLQMRERIVGAFARQTASAYAVQAVIASIAVAVIVAWQASREALRVRYRRQLLVCSALLLVWCFASILLALAVHNGIAPAFLAGAVFNATFWIWGAAMLAATSYLVWSGFAQRALTIRYAGGALALSAVFVATWLAGMPARPITEIAWLTLLILTASFLAPWSLNRVRHT
jgi:hypothetical protein